MENVAAMVVNGTCEADWGAVAELARQAPTRIIPSYGIHPWAVTSATPGWEAALARRLDAAGGPCGVGEIGLDRWKTRAHFDLQQRLFRQQLRMGAERNLPVTIHCLRAWGALLEIMESEPLPRRGFLLHAYSGASELVPRFVRLGAYFSFSGSFLAPERESRRETFRQIPLERWLVETDAPFMPPPAGRTRFPLPPGAGGERLNHPANLPAIYEGATEALGMPPETVTRQVAHNFQTFFGNRNHGKPWEP